VQLAINKAQLKFTKAPRLLVTAANCYPAWQWTELLHQALLTGYHTHNNV
jgi:hypothetical protein